MGVDPASLAAYAAVASAAIGGTTAIVAANKKSTKPITAASVDTNDAINQADDLLRKRQRTGVNANLLTGSTGDGSISSSSTGQKTLLGG